MGYSKAELESALADYTRVVEGCSASGDWSPFADNFTEDVHYIEHAYGELHGREAVREWIQKVMAPFPHMRFPQGWTAYDEENGAVVMLIKNLLDHPTDPAGEHWTPVLKTDMAVATLYGQLFSNVGDLPAKPA